MHEVALDKEENNGQRKTDFIRTCQFRWLTWWLHENPLTGLKNSSTLNVIYYVYTPGCLSICTDSEKQ